MFKPIDILISSGNIASKLYGFYNLDLKQEISDRVTPENIAYGASAAAALGAILAYPPTRIALCTLLSMSYTLTTLSLQLVLMGLYLAVSGAQTLGSAADLTKDLLSKSMAPKGQELPIPANVQKVLDDVKAMEDAFENISPVVQPELTDEFFDEVLKDMEAVEKAPSKPEELNRLQKAFEEVESKPQTDWAQQFKGAQNLTTKGLSSITDSADVWVREMHVEEMVEEFTSFKKAQPSKGNKLLAAGAAVLTVYAIYKSLKIEKRDETLPSIEVQGPNFA